MSVHRLEQQGDTTSFVSRDPNDIRDNDYMDIDLRALLEIPLSWWREILLCTVAFAIIGAAIAYYQNSTTPPLYETAADVIIERVINDITLVDSFRTNSDQVNLSSSANNSRREALVLLVTSGAVAEKVAIDLSGLLTEDEQKPATLLRMVSAQAQPGADERTVSSLIRIKVQADQPEKAEAIANSWARQYVSHINSVYNQVPLETYTSIEVQMEQAYAEYVSAQEAFEAFTRDNQLDTLQNQLAQKTLLRTNYLDAQTALTTQIVEQDRATRLKLFNDLVTAQNEAFYTVFAHQSQDKIKRLAELYQANNLTERQLQQAQNLRQQITYSAELSASDALALQLLKTQIYATVEGSNLPAGITIDLGTQGIGAAGNGDLQADVETLIATLEAYITQLQSEITTISQALLAGTGYSFIDQYAANQLAITASPITQTVASENGENKVNNELSAAIMQRYYDLFRIGELAQLSQPTSSMGLTTDLTAMIERLNQEIESINGDLAAESAKQLFLTQQRDLRWNTFNTLSNKVVELQLARTAANTEVRFASAAVTPTTPLPGMNNRMITLAAGVCGLVFSIMAVYIANLFGKRPWFSRQQEKTLAA